MSQPVISFRQNISPFSTLSSLTLTGSGSGGAVVAGQQSTIAAFRIYNNFANAGGISDAVNCELSSYDTATDRSGMLTAPVTQQWLQVKVLSYNESVTSADLQFFPIGGLQKHAVPVNGGTLNASPITDPASGPSLSASGSGSGLLAGAYQIAYTYLSGQGETLLSPTTSITITAGQNIVVGALTPPANCTGINYYLTYGAGGITNNQVGQGTGAAFTISTTGSASSAPGSNTTNVHFFDIALCAVPNANTSVSAVNQGLWLEYSWT